MRLLICTQIVDMNDPVLGFFHRWIEELAAHCESVEVICLKEGGHALPENVHVHSLGKESGRASRAHYAIRFLRLAWNLRREYDAVFVHMNQEYVLLAGLMWRSLGKKIGMWRNHYAGSFLTNIAVSLCDVVFCTSKSSYTARFKKTRIMPVGIDTETFKPDAAIPRRPRSILSLGRLDESKRIHVLIETLGMLKGQGTAFSATIVGSPSGADSSYLDRLKHMAADTDLTDVIAFRPAVTQPEAAQLYREHELFVNLSPSGMYDKTIFEAAASGCLVLTSSADWARAVSSEFSTSAEPRDIAQKLASLLELDDAAAASRTLELRNLALKHSLGTLADDILKVLR